MVTKDYNTNLYVSKKKNPLIIVTPVDISDVPDIKIE